jgi:hypothetical protein
MWTPRILITTGIPTPIPLCQLMAPLPVMRLAMMGQCKWMASQRGTGSPVAICWDTRPILSALNASSSQRRALVPLLISGSSSPVQMGTPLGALRINFSSAVCAGGSPSYTPTWRRQSRLWVPWLLYCSTVCTKALWHIYIFGLISCWSCWVLTNSTKKIAL